MALMKLYDKIIIEVREFLVKAFSGETSDKIFEFVGDSGKYSLSVEVGDNSICVFHNIFETKSKNILAKYDKELDLLTIFCQPYNTSGSEIRAFQKFSDAISQAVRNVFGITIHIHRNKRSNQKKIFFNVSMSFNGEFIIKKEKIKCTDRMIASFNLKEKTFWIETIPSETNVYTLEALV